jgi:hypothetical protein
MKKFKKVYTRVQYDTLHQFINFYKNQVSEYLVKNSKKTHRTPVYCGNAFPLHTLQDKIVKNIKFGIVAKLKFTAYVLYNGEIKTVMKVANEVYRSKYIFR